MTMMKMIIMYRKQRIKTYYNLKYLSKYLHSIHLMSTLAYTAYINIKTFAVVYVFVFCSISNIGLHVAYRVY